MRGSFSSRLAGCAYSGLISGVLNDFAQEDIAAQRDVENIERLRIREGVRAKGVGRGAVDVARDGARGGGDQ